MTDAFDPARVEADVRRWLERAVIGLNLCPFAKAVYARNQVRIVVSDASTERALLEQLGEEMALLRDTPAGQVDTTLLVHPQVLGDFLDFNDFLDDADALVEALDLDGVLQVASFHPHYQFAGTEPDDAVNLTNHAPYPILHIVFAEFFIQVVHHASDVAVELQVYVFHFFAVDTELVCAVVGAGKTKAEKVWGIVQAKAHFINGFKRKIEGECITDRGKAQHAKALGFAQFGHVVRHITREIAVFSFVVFLPSCKTLVVAQGRVGGPGFGEVMFLYYCCYYSCTSAIRFSLENISQTLRLFLQVA